MPMFDQLADKLQAAFAKLRGNQKLTEADIDTAMREVRIALLEADVNFKVVKDFIARVKESALGGEVLEGLNAGQQVVKIVHDEMVRLLSGVDPETVDAETAPAPLTFAAKPPTVIMLCGLQGAGKTTLAGKLAKLLSKQGKACVLAACDVQRPAAVQQLKVVGEQVKTAVYSVAGGEPVRIAREAVQFARDNRADVVILDTAGRLHVDDALMDELRAVRDETKPDEVLLVLDAMTGQDAVNVAKEFNDAIGVDGFVLTKIDGDTRGGAAISVRAVIGKPIKFVGVGEKMDALEPFYPDRMASRILGMGDVLSLIEKAEAAFDEKNAKEMEKKLRTGKFDFEDFLAQMQQMRRLGPLQQLMEMLPGVSGKLKDSDFAAGEQEMARFEAIVRSMTMKERRNPEIINGARRKRIAAGSGTSVQQVNQVLTNFEQMRQMMKMLSSGNIPGMPNMAKMAGMGGLSPMARTVIKRKKDAKSNKPNNGGGGSNRFKMPFGRG